MGRGVDYMSGLFTELAGYLRMALPRRANVVSLHIHKERFNELKTYETYDNQEYVVLQVSAHSLRKVLDEKRAVAAVSGRKNEEDE